MTDNELAFRAGNNDVIAFEELYYRHHRRVYRLCFRILQNTHLAEDLTQDVFVQLFRKIGSFKGDAVFTTWFHCLMVNQVRMYLRKPMIKNERTTEDGNLPEQIVLGTKRPSKMAIIDKIALGSAMEQLPNGYKQVLILHDIEGYTHNEVARILGYTPGTSKSQLHRARLKMRNLLLQQSDSELVSAI